MSEILYNENTLMKNGYPRIRKLGACSPNGEMTPFVWNGRLMRVELADPSRGVDPSRSLGAGVRDVETGEFLSYFAQDSYYHSAYLEGDTLYVTGVDMHRRDTIRLYESKDLKTWTSRDLLTNPGWLYCNSQIARGPGGYVIILESGPNLYPHLSKDDYPRKYMGNKGWTMFFARSADMVHWEFMDYEKPFCLEEHTGGPCLKYSDGWFYLLADLALPRRIYTSYLLRTKDFETWYVGYYNPIIMPSDDDRKISPHYTEITEAEAKAIALNHAGFAEADVSGLRVERDYDDGRLEYKVEFRVGNTEYEYEILAADGSILDFEKDRDD